MSTFTLADLAAIIAERARAADPASSYTAKLLAAGVDKCAKKFGEEAMEAALAAVSEDDAALTAEAGDVLYHLLVMLEARGISLDAVMSELEKRTRQSGLTEKTGRKPK
jgi:phosphoribosyl-ATP pyrophosphohydrolase